ncbi:g_PROTEIN_RECEP_F1_2 domain-containing protein [Caerostris darwini]|uniref:G_PROTEIN_RECEP_F1_2 domain-containing protein n=1 Tax=Caerostris darwini TaxID=1538125 RepID=A0AAV4XB74_9ARAC|nr:g_PROTEIN_RECEP_F1_2 domain-containing protein [Caerostris darwini]
MILPWSHCSRGNEVDGVLVLLSVATATLSFFLNLLQMAVIVHQRLLQRNPVVLHLCVCGQLSCAPVLCSLLISAPNVAPAALHMFTLFTFAPLITLLVLQQHPLGRTPLALPLLLLLSWCQALLISLLPLSGWQGSRPAALLCALYFLHYPLVLILLADLCLKRASNRVGIARDVESWGQLALAEHTSKVEKAAITESPTQMASETVNCHLNRNIRTKGGSVKIENPPPFRLRHDALLVTLWGACTLPFFCHTAVLSGLSWDFCDSLAANERTALWTSWMTMLFAALRPIFHSHTEDYLGEGTVTLINVLCRVKESKT